jgi:hypothetical protein
MMSVLLGYSTLIYTVFVIESKADGAGYTHQGKLLGPLLMNLLAFKFVIASSKIPKAAYATIFDRILLSCELLFFSSILLISVTLLLARNPLTTAVAATFQTSAPLVLLAAWLLWGMYIAVKVRCGIVQKAIASQDGVPGTQNQASQRRRTPDFETESRTLLEDETADIASDIAAEDKTSVLLRIRIKQVHSVNAATATFACEFTTSLSWLCEEARGMDAGTILNKQQLEELHMPKLRLHNALTCTTKVLQGSIVDAELGHVRCEVHFKAQVLMKFHLERFPFDTQALVVFLQMANPMDMHRRLLLAGCDVEETAIKISEWTVSREPFETVKIHEGAAQAIFGLTIQRQSRYYITTVVSLLIWSLFVLSIFTLDFDEYHERGKICVGVLLVQVASKLAVASKLPRIANVTDYDLLALNSLGLNFGIACTAALCHALGRFTGLSRDFIKWMDMAFGLLLLLMWALMNLRVVRSMCQALAAARQQQPGALPTELSQLPGVEEQNIEEAISSDTFGSAELSQLLRRKSASVDAAALSSTDSKALSSTTTQPELEANLATGAFTLSTKVWMVSNIEGGMFECKFHVFLEWNDSAAIELPETTRIPHLTRPKLAIKNAIMIMREDCSPAEVRNSKTGHVSCHIQYHVRLFQRFDLRFFPFDYQRLSVDLELKDAGDASLVADACDANDQTRSMDGWHLCAFALQQESPQHASMLLLVRRQSGFYILNVIMVYFAITTIIFSFFLMRPGEFAKRMVDSMKIVLTQTVFRFQMGHRLPSPKRWTLFDVYILFCQAICCFIVLFFIYSAVSAKGQSKACIERDELPALIAFLCIWVCWHIFFVLRVRHVKHAQLTKHMLERSNSSTRGSRLSDESSILTGSDITCRQTRGSVYSAATCISTAQKPWEVSKPLDIAEPPQVISAAFRIWLIRNVDLVTATFECKFRVFLEWLDDAAIGLPKGKKAKLPVPEVVITNAVQSQVLDKSSAPEVVNPDTGHLALQILFRATLKLDQEVHNFPFDCQWLAINMSLRDEGDERAQTFMFQYCEVDDKLQLDEWEISEKPAFSTMMKQDAASIQDTVTCGILVRRCSRYYNVNVLAPLGLISSLTFATYIISVEDFWERAEIFVGIFPMTIIFKMVVQTKLPRVGYMTKFDIYGFSCQVLFFIVVFECMLASAVIKFSQMSNACLPPYGEDDVVKLVKDVEAVVWRGFAVVWLAWNAYFIVQAIRVQRVEPYEALRKQFPMTLQEDRPSIFGNRVDVSGLSDRLSIMATAEAAELLSEENAEIAEKEEIEIAQI